MAVSTLISLCSPILLRHLYLYVAIENAVYFGYIDPEEGELKAITEAGAADYDSSAQNKPALRSEISVEPEFPICETFSHLRKPRQLVEFLRRSIQIVPSFHGKGFCSIKNW